MLARIPALMLLLALAGSPAATSAEADLAPAIEPVAALYDALFECMKAGATLDLEGRRAKLAPVVDRAYDLQFMGAKTLGSHWRALDQSERGRWLEAFRRLTVATYAERFSDWSGEKLEVLDAVPADRGTAVVHTRVVPAKEEPIEINYRMRPGDDGWRIIDVYLNGTVSELALRRSEYSAVIDRDGFNHLIESLDEKTLAPGPASPGKQ